MSYPKIFATSRTSRFDRPEACPAAKNELRTVLSTAIDDLPEDYRTAFLMHDVEGLSNPEIAESLGISLPAVKSRVHRSRLFLRQRLSRYLTAA